MSRSLIIEQKGCPNPGDGGGGKEEVGDKDPHFNHEPHREPYREINEAHEQNQFVSGIEREAVAAKPHQADDEREQRGEDYGEVEDWIARIQVGQQLEPGHICRVGCVGEDDALQVELGAGCDGGTQESESCHVGTGTVEGHRQRRSEQDGRSRRGRDVGPHQRLTQAEQDSENADQGEWNPAAPHHKKDDRRQIESCWEGLSTIPGEDPEHGELHRGKKQAKQNQAIGRPSILSLGRTYEQKVEQPKGERIGKGFDQRKRLVWPEVGVEREETGKQWQCDAVLFRRLIGATENRSNRVIEELVRIAHAVVLNQEEGEGINEDEDGDNQKLPAARRRGAVRWDIRRRPLMLGWGDGAHGFSVSPEECL